MYTINSEKYNENMINIIQLYYKNRIPPLNYDIFTVKQINHRPRKHGTTK
jgi:hypothetical protein